MLNFEDFIWIRAEIAQISISNQHRYIELVQYEKETEQVKARSSALIWANQYKLMQSKHKMDIDNFWLNGSQVLIKAKIEFHPTFGLNIIIDDFEPNYTLGQLALLRKDNLAKLESQGLINKNKSLFLPPVIQKIALISSDKASGLTDFIHQIENNPYKYKFDIDLYESKVQGTEAANQMIQSLRKIYSIEKNYDIVILVRGGGSKLDLAAFDTFELSKNIAEHPIPVLTGIGHQTDISLADIVAHSYHKTPTAVADFILHHNALFEIELTNLQNQIARVSKQKLQYHCHKINLLADVMPSKLKANFQQQHLILEGLKSMIETRVPYHLKINTFKLNTLENYFKSIDPKETLKRGFAIITDENKKNYITSIIEIEKNQKVQIILHDGKATAIIL